MSADPFVQDPTNTQSLNRYSYVGNNPLSYTDPTGYFSLGKFLKTLIAIVVVVVAAIYGQGWVASAIYGSGTAGAAACAAACATIAGAIGGAIAGGITGGNLRSVVTGAISGAVFARLGFAAKAGAWTDSQRFVAFGLTGGVSSVAQGGNFQSGFLAAGFSALAQPYIDVVANDNVFVGAAASAAVGGASSVLGGGKFANGAVTGAFSYAVGRAMAGGHKNGSEKSSNDNAAASNNLDAAKGTVALGHLVGPAIGGGIVREALKQALIRMFGAGTGAAVYELIYGEGKVDHLYHFTNDAGRAGISATGYISQSADGYVYLTLT
jgi:hypothetical protein